jgi:mxaJ protein
VVPLKSEPGVKFDYEMAMGVRYGEREWKQKVESLIDSQQPAIQTILKEYGVPVVDASYEAPKGATKDGPVTK